MPRVYEKRIGIAAPPAAVWPVMSNVAGWPEWTPGVRRIVTLTPGDFGMGSRARVYQPGLPPALWKVTGWQPGREFVWVSVAPGIRVTATHRVEEDECGSRVTLGLDYAGPLGGLLAWLTHKYNTSYLETEARGLKARCEALANGKTPPRPAPMGH